MRIAIVGGGISGLSAAREALQEAGRRGLGAEIVLFEAAPHLGGKVRTERRWGSTVEAGPDSFMTRKASALALCEALGLHDALIAPDPSAGSALIWTGERLRPFPAQTLLGMPGRIGPLARTRLLSPAGKLRAFMEPLVGRAPRADDPSIWEAVAARFGKQVASNLVAPLIGALYGDPRDLSLRATLPDIEPMLARGSVLRTLSRSFNGQAPSGPSFLAFRGGMSRLIESVAQSLANADVRLGLQVQAIARESSGFTIHPAGGERIHVDAVVLAVPAPSAARLLADAAPDAAAPLRAIRHPPLAVVFLRYAPEALPQLVGSVGFIVPPDRVRAVSACTVVSRKWPQPSGETLIVRASVRAPAMLDLDDGDLQSRAAQDIAAAAGGGDPEDAFVVRWEPGTPMYECGHQARVAAAEAALPPGIVLAGASYRGSGIPECIDDGMRAGLGIVAHFAARS